MAARFTPGDRTEQCPSVQEPQGRAGEATSGIEPHECEMR
jgi:hypothetical protein